ncbi:MAG: NAD(P)-dependent oxidoreductase [Hyphomonadaceae bacterium]|nr:NAD(P)-dependent oxidoreductase [Hyphomonadaceae bacterium]
MAAKIGFIGLGAMGLPMASNLQRKGFQLTAFDVVPARIEELVTLGANAGKSIADTARGADIVVTMLPATAHVESVILGPDGVLANIAPGAVIMDMSTIDANGTRRVAEACAAKGVSFTDCPVGRLVSHAIRGESLFMVGADDATYERIRPLLEAMGTAIYRCGGPGMGSCMKLVNNFMLLTITEVCAEAITLGAKLGLDIETMKTVTGATTATNGQFQVAMATKSLVGDIEPGFTIDLAFKDMTLAINAAAEQRVGLPVGSAAHAVYGGARATAYASKDFSAVLQLACERAGISAPRLTQS